LLNIGIGLTPGAQTQLREQFGYAYFFLIFHVCIIKQVGFMGKMGI